MRAIACAVLIIGLLKFCQDAPELFKTLFSAGGDMLKGMNPFGAAKRDLQAAGKTLTQAKDAGKAVGHALGTPFRAGAAIGKGAAGAIAGAKAGANANEDQNFFNKLVGGARGLVAGGSAGVHNQGFKGTTTAAEYAGANAATAKARGIFGDAQGDLNKSYGILMDRAKSDIDKEKDKKKAADENYKQQVNEYVNGRLSDDNYINSIIAQQQAAAVDQKLNEKVAAQAAANNVSEDVIRNNATMMSRLQSEAAREVAPIGREEALGIAKEQASNEAKALYEADKEKAKTDADNKIAEIMGNQLASEPEMRNAQQIVDAFAKSKEKWGSDIENQFNSNLSEALSKIDVNSAIGKNIKDVFGKDLNNINVNDLQKMISDVNSGARANDDATRQAIAQVMSKVDSSAKKTNTNLSVASQIGEVYQANPPKSNDSESK